MYVIYEVYYYLHLKYIISINIENYVSTAHVTTAVCTILSYDMILGSHPVAVVLGN